MDARVATAQDSNAILTRTLTPRQPGGVRIPLFLPKVVTRWERDPFSLRNINLASVESLGRQFADDNAPTLTRKALDAERDETGQTRVVIHDATGHVAASQATLPFDTIEGDLIQRLLATNAVEQSVTEMNAATAVAKAFLRGAEVTEKTPWRAEHGRLATARLTEWISGLQTSSPVREVNEVIHVRWPDPSERTEARPPADRHVVTVRADFERWYPYSGWDKSIYEINSFDAYSTEFLLANIFETADAVKAWVRIDQTVPLRINYLVGAVQKSYEPDFIVIDEHNTYWVVEGKANSEMTDNVVLAKRDAARHWVTTVNTSAEVHDKWAYLLASEAVIASAPSWEALKNGGQAYQ
jgi:type III restriction enzyme